MEPVHAFKGQVPDSLGWGTNTRVFQRLLNAAGQQKQGQQVFEIHDHRP